MSRSRRPMAATLAIVATVSAATALLPSSASAVPAPPGCAQVEVITVRGQYEAQNSNGSVLGPMSSALQSRLSQTVSVYPLPYDASADVVGSSNRGIRLLTDRMVQQRRVCPDTRFVVLGFSLGAIVVGETFAPPSTRYSGLTRYALPSSVDAKVAAVAMFGDGRFHSGGPEAYGSFTPGTNGQIARPPSAFARFAEKVGNVCNVNDGVCQTIPAAQIDPAAHQDYVKYTDQLVWWVSQRVALTP